MLLVLAGCVYTMSRTAGDDSLEVEGLVHAVSEAPLRIGAAVRASVIEPVHEILRREHLHEHIADLEGQLATANARIDELREAGRENRRLEALLGLRPHRELGGRVARIIATGPGPLRSVVIDAGELDGIAVDRAVIAPQGLVGRVISIGPRTSVVQLVVDAASGMAAIDERTRVQGVLVGTGGDSLRLRYVPNLEEVRPGDRLLTAGLDGIYPKGLTIGEVTAVSPGVDAFKVIEIEPAVPMRRLETVLVLDVAPIAVTASTVEQLAAVRPLRGTAP